jgi:predicted transcriptional regulator
MNDEVIKVKVLEHDETLKEHGKRLDKIEQESAEFRAHIKNLCKKIDELTSWIKALIVAMISTFGGFIIWYIQSLR